MNYAIYGVLFAALCCAALSHRVLHIYASLATGWLSTPLDITLSTPLGVFDRSSLVLFAILCSSLLYILRNTARCVPALSRFQAHALFLIFAFCALAWSPSLTYGLRTFIKLLAPFVFAVVVYASVRGEDDTRRIMRFIVVIGFMVCGVAVGAFITGASSHSVLTWPGMTPALFSAFLLVPFSISVGWAFFSGGRWWVASIIFAGCIVGSVTRITIAALFLVAATAFVLVKRGPLRIAAPLVILGGCLALFLSVDRFRQEMFLHHSDDIDMASVFADPGKTGSFVAGSGRYEAWDAVLSRFFFYDPFFGAGLGATQEYFYAGSKLHVGVIHSEVVRLLCETGAVGLALWCIMLISYTYRSVSLFKSIEPAAKRSTALAASCSILSYGVFMLTDNAIDYVNCFGAFVFCMMALVAKEDHLRKVDIKIVRGALPCGGTGRV